ncbi:catalase-like [Periplaneta americana]|uniref:catalase-like n=1 Tax=Periplaneta americana TaxID=6978 RepID=UPI0037E9289A
MTYCAALLLLCSTALTHDPVSDQLLDYQRTHQDVNRVVTGYGVPVSNIAASLTAGYHGPVLLQDVVFLDTLAHFDRERIPERVVHAKGAGAFGYFEVTHDITEYTKAVVFSNVGKKTPIAVRFSFVTGETGSADTMRDPRGFSIKFYTEDGIWDLVGNNTPIFFIRDPILFPLFIHSQKRNPATHLKDANMFWDFISLRPETTHQVMITFSDRGIPDGYRYMHGYGSHTFKMVNHKKEAVYVKFHYKTDQGIRNLSSAKAANISGIDPDYAIRDLYNAIARGDFPTWTFYIQVMTFHEAKNFRWNPFDLTKVWPQEDFPLIPVGKVVLNQNPSNYFAEVEQIGFSPAHMIPGIEPSPDKMLHGRLFTYSDTQRYRLGPNYLQFPINSPFRSQIVNFQRDGPQTFSDNQKGAPNYFPNSFGGPKNDPSSAISSFNVTGDVARHDSGDEDNFSQPSLLWRNVLKSDERDRLVQNIVDSLKNAADFIQDRTVEMFNQVDPEFGHKLSEGLSTTFKTAGNYYEFI